MSLRHRGHERSCSQQVWQQQTWPQGRKTICVWGEETGEDMGSAAVPNAHPRRALQSPALHPRHSPARRAPGPGLCREHEHSGPEGRTRVRADLSSPKSASHGCSTGRPSTGAQ